LALEYAIPKIKENQVELKFNWRHQLLMCVESQGDNLGMIKMNTKLPINRSKEVGLQVNTKKNKFMLIFHHQHTGQICNVKVVHRSLKNVEKFRYLGTVCLLTCCLKM
jgi:hypothetical protein